MCNIISLSHSLRSDGAHRDDATPHSARFVLLLKRPKVSVRDQHLAAIREQRGDPLIAALFFKASTPALFSKSAALFSKSKIRPCLSPV